MQVSRVTDEERRAPKRAVHLTLVSFAVTRKAYEVITEQFAREYEEQTGVPVRFRLSFGGSGTQVIWSACVLHTKLLPSAVTMQAPLVQLGYLRPACTSLCLDAMRTITGMDPLHHAEADASLIWLLLQQ